MNRETTTAVCISIGTVLMPLTSNATVVFPEGFESYEDQSAFEMVWETDGVPLHQLDTTHGRGASTSVKLIGSEAGNGITDRFVFNLPDPMTLVGGKQIEFRFDFFLAAAGALLSWSDDWQLVDIRGYSGGAFKVGELGSVLAIGLSMATPGDADFHNDDYFQGRIVAPGPMQGLHYTLDEEDGAVRRSPGRHRLEAVYDRSATLFRVDGVVAEKVDIPYSGPATSVVLGSGLPAEFDYWVDNISIRVLPEPGAVALSLVILSWLLTIRTRRKTCWKSGHGSSDVNGRARLITSVVQCLDIAP